MIQKQITSLTHPLVKHLVKLRENKAYRYENKSILLEGRKVIEEICQKTPATTLITLESTSIPEHLSYRKAVEVSYPVLQKITATKTPESILAEIPFPDFETLEKKKTIVVFDGLSDPGNLGTLLRTALALGWEGAYLLPTTCDPFNDKALRAARGATFRLPMRIGNWEELEILIRKNKMHAFVADLSGISLELIKNEGPLVLVLGHEAHGVSNQANRLCSPITIPMPGDMESLNVAIAGGILMYKLTKK